MKTTLSVLLATALIFVIDGLSSAKAQALDTNSLTNGLVAYYPFDGSFNDKSVNKNNITSVSSGAILSKDQFGIDNSALFLTQDTDYAYSSNNVGINGNQSFSISVWVNYNRGVPHGIGTGDMLVGFGNSSRTGGVANLIFWGEQWNGKKGSIILWGAYDDTYVDNLGVGFLNNIWRNIVYTYNKNDNFNCIYVNGQLCTNINQANAIPNIIDSIIKIGDWRQLGGWQPGPQGATIDNIRIYNRALSSNEVAALYAMESTPPPPPVTTDTFGTGTNQFGIDFVTVGNPGNSNDTTGYGGVPYSYRIGKYTISQNQIDAATRNGLQNVTAGAWSGDQPAANISWYEAAACVNWLNTNAGFRPAYNLTFTNGAWSMALWPTTPDTNGNVAWTLGGTNLFRNAAAYYFLPSENEWYKAAYYDPNKNGGSGGYWQYATISDTAPTPVASGIAAGTAVYNAQLNPASVFLSGGLSPYGTMGQGGVVWQWVENATGLGDDRVLRGGYRFYSDHDNTLASSYRPSYYPNYEGDNQSGGLGFRVASVDDSWLTNGLVAWYPFDGNANDIVGGNNLTQTKEISYAGGRFSNSQGAIQFNTTTSFAQSVNPIGISGNSDRTVTFWVRDQNPLSSGQYLQTDIYSWGIPNGAQGTAFSMHLRANDGGQIYAGGNYADYVVSNIGDIFQNHWNQISYVYNGRVASTCIYLNGVKLTNNIFYHDVALNTPNNPLRVGDRGDGRALEIPGTSLSDLRIYNRALSSSEVAQLFALESMPPVPTAPPAPLTITEQPFNRSMDPGQTASFSVEATGSGSVTYQWKKDGVALAGMTNSSLVITNAQAKNVGYYTCDVTDANGSVTSSNAALNITGVPFGLWQGLVAYYPFNGNVNNESIDELNGINSGTTSDADRFGNLNSARKFDSKNKSHIEVPWNTNLSSNVTCFSFWFKTDGPQNEARFILSGEYEYDYSFHITSAFRIDGLRFIPSAYVVVDSASNEFYQPSVWNHVIAISGTNSSNVGIWLNGQKITTENTLGDPLIPAPHFSERLWIGGRIGDQSYSGFYFNGWIDDVRIYNRALSSNEVASLYALESTPPGPTNSQTIDFPEIPRLSLTNGAYTIGATASSGLPVSYAITDTNVATLISNTITPLALGTTTIVATQAGDTNWMAASPVTNRLVITKSPQNLPLIDGIGELRYGEAPSTLNLPLTNALGLPITYSVKSGPAILNGNILTLTGAGTVTLAANQSGSALYEAATEVTASFEAKGAKSGLKSQSINFKQPTARTFGGKSMAPSATASSKLPVTFWSSNTNVAVISGTNIVITGAGQSVITAYQPGDGTTYNAAVPVAQTLVVNPAAQKITFKSLKATLLGAVAFNPGATASSGLPVTYASSDTNIVVLTTSGTNTLILPVGVGVATITASQPGTANISAASPVTQALTVGKGSQTITLASLPAKTYGDAPFTPVVTSSAGLPVTLLSSATNVAVIGSNNVITITGAGSAKITASQAGNASVGTAKPVIQNLTVAKANQTISFSLPADVSYIKGGLVTLGGTASSGLPMAYKSGNAKILAITGTTCVITGKGSTTVTASQAGDKKNYNAANPVTVTVTVQ